MRTTILLIVCSLLYGCGGFAMRTAIKPAMANLQHQPDLDLVCEGAPALLLMIDSLLAARPNDTVLLRTGVEAYASYAMALQECNRSDRAAVISSKARTYGLALLNRLPGLATIQVMTAEEIPGALNSLKANEVETLYWGALGWAVWIQNQQGSPASLADLFRVEKIMERVVALDDTVDHGGPHLFLGAYHGARPRLLGGDPELSSRHFVRALEINNREYLPVLVAFAETYARMAFDRLLFQNLLQEVMAFPIEQRPDLTLVNGAAKRRAQRLLNEIDTFF